MLADLTNRVRFPLAQGLCIGGTAGAPVDPVRLIAVGLVLISAVYFGFHATLFYSDLDVAADGLGHSGLTDFFAFYSAARSLWDGGAAASLYDSPALKAVQMSLGAGAGGAQPFNYPPTYLFLIWPFGGLRYAPALVLWQATTLTAFVLSLRLIGLRGLWLLAAVVAPATIMNFAAGQNGCLTAALLVGGMALSARQQGAAGGLFGILTFKPHLGILLPVACLAERRWTVIAVAAGTALVLGGASISVFGLGSWTAYFDFLGPLSRAIEAENSGSFISYSVSALMAAKVAGLPKMLAYAIQGTLSAGVIGTVYYVFRRPVDSSLRLALLLVGVSLTTPYLFVYDLLFVAVAVILVARDAMADRFLPYEMPVLVAAWFVPIADKTLVEHGFAIGPWVHIMLFAFVLWRIRARTGGTTVAAGLQAP